MFYYGLNNSFTVCNYYNLNKRALIKNTLAAKRAEISTLNCIRRKNLSYYAGLLSDESSDNLIPTALSSTRNTICTKSGKFMHKMLNSLQ